MDKPKILIVDDEPFNVDYIEQELEDAAYETLTASDGQEALDQVSAGKPDLVLLDIMMPVMDGFEVLSRLKASVETREIPVIVISASNDLKSVVRGIQLGAEDYLPKPFEPTLLGARISSCLEKKRLRDLEKLYLKSLERELEIGREIQMGFLPPKLPVVPGWEIAAYFNAAREVAGDYYDAFLLPDGNLICVVGDVCGKGVGAALYMSLFRSLIRATSKTGYFFTQTGLSEQNHAERLQQVISFVNNYVADTHGHTSMFSTVFIFILDQEKNTLTYINCGNEPAFLVRKDGETITLWPTGPIVGIIPNAGYTATQLDMGEDDLLLAYTDGVTDALNTSGQAYGRQRLMDLVKAAQTNTVTCDGLLKSIQGELQQYIGTAVQFDDITALGVKRLKAH
jgi:serine phosphatase RsbU (regulator of sigma subunit)